jgi:hypothetical protein
MRHIGGVMKKPTSRSDSEDSPSDWGVFFIPSVWLEGKARNHQEIEIGDHHGFKYGV